MKRLIICCDGTWNTPDQEDNGVPAPTNVFKLFNAVADSQGDIPQIKYYHPGLGSKGGRLHSLFGGAFGAGISHHICSAYHWISQNYEEGDQIYLYGFSRGAFTVRSLSGFLACGLLNLTGLEPDRAWDRVHTLYQRAYRKKKTSGPWTTESWDFFLRGKALPIRFVGVWDTVGALGIPDDLELLNILDNRRKWQFHNTELGQHIQTARHAIAIDEIRANFSATRWSNAQSHPDARELWFPGVHADVGGGYSNTDLSNGALLWMITESAAAELKFRNGTALSFSIDPLGVLHNSFKGLFSKMRSRPRNIPAMVQNNRQHFHPAALQRQEASPISYKPYYPTKILKPGESHFIDVHADTRWNETGLYFEKSHKYSFEAQGTWLSGQDSCDWRGLSDGQLTTTDIMRGVSSFLGKFETLYKQMSDNESSDFIATKRIEAIDWMQMVGAVANDCGLKRVVKNDGSPVPHQYIALCEHERQTLEVENSGYFFCFANDIWSRYENNRGSIQLTVTRIE